MKLLFNYFEGEFLGCINDDFIFNEDDGYWTFNSFEEAYVFFRNSPPWNTHWELKAREGEKQHGR